MKTKILTFLAASALAFFSACSDDGGSKSIADICREGLSEDCLIGNWTLKSISNTETEDVITDFTNEAGGKMEFRADSNIYHYSRIASGVCTGVDKGEWSIDGDKLIINENKLGDCIEFKKYTVTPTIKVSDAGDTIQLILNKVIFQQDESDGMAEGKDTEVFVRVE